MVLYIGIAGFFGAISRYLVSGLIHRSTGTLLPYGTLAVNIIGSFLLAFIMEFSSRSSLISDEARIFLGIGFLGAFTTFSSFSYETLRLLEDGSTILASLNITLNMALCLGFAFAGFALARSI